MLSLVSHLERSIYKKDASYSNLVAGGVSQDVLHGHVALLLVQITALLWQTHQIIGS